ncbi:MAG: cbb3-type cytochrome c oxidase subunit III [Ignavibacteria bacterium]|nr:MAG: cbb3-type cytochrome c oxidase subunit III [Ignavibacteria bacterium]KAF0161892.1 MAG: cbb3-type cytochrome c oxidase subunit III [Ignavibacteria bacterium]
MKSINKFLFKALFAAISLLGYSQAVAATESSVDMEAVMRTMLVLTIIVILAVLWLAIVYSEKNDNEGDDFLRPVRLVAKYLVRLQPMEKEKDLLFHHEFDGIRELDNRIPPWFNFLFYGTIIWAVIYLMVFHVFDDGQIQHKEYLAEMNHAKVEKDYLIKTGAFINEETVKFVNDAASLSEGKDIYDKNCVSCHLADGGGLVGPNLADEYWIHGGGIKNVFKIIKDGVPAKGMIAWQSQLDSKKMQAVSSYVLSFQGTKPANPKAPEGPKWEESKTDSISVKKS